jgi:hypothetical protein
VLVMAAQSGTKIIPIAPASAGLRIAMLGYGFVEVTGEAVDIARITAFSFGVGAALYLTALGISVAILGREFGTASPRRSRASPPRRGSTAAGAIAGGGDASAAPPRSRPLTMATSAHLRPGGSTRGFGRRRRQGNATRRVRDQVERIAGNDRNIGRGHHRQRVPRGGARKVRGATRPAGGGTLLHRRRPLPPFASPQAPASPGRCGDQGWASHPTRLRGASWRSPVFVGRAGPPSLLRSSSNPR